MKVGLVLPLFSGDVARVLGSAREAEEGGFDGIFVFDHMFSGRGRDGASLEAFATLAAVSAATHEVMVGTLVTRPGLRSVPLLARIAASVQDMSGGRLILGVGTGDVQSDDEQSAYGLPPAGDAAERLETTRETVMALRSMLETGSWVGGARIPAARGPLGPIPSTRTPIWLGGSGASVVRMAAEIADGWNAWGIDLGGFAARMSGLAAASRGRTVEATWGGLALVGRDEEELERLISARRGRGLGIDGLWRGTGEGLASHIRELASAGATWAILMLAGPADRARLVADRVLPEVRRE